MSSRLTVKTQELTASCGVYWPSGRFLTCGLHDTPLGTAQVTLIEESVALISLHSDIVDVLLANDAMFNEPQHFGAGFLPHCTIQATERVQPDVRIGIHSVSLVDMFVGNDWRQRKVLAEFKLGDQM